MPLFSTGEMALCVKCQLEKHEALRPGPQNSSGKTRHSIRRKVETARSLKLTASLAELRSFRFTEGLCLRRTKVETDQGKTPDVNLWSTRTHTYTYYCIHMTLMYL